MSETKIDLSKIAEEIKAKKSELHGVDTRANQPITNNRDAFLFDLMESFKTGNKQSPAVTKIKQVENKAVERSNQKTGRNERPVFGDSDYQQPQQQRQGGGRTVLMEDDDRENKMFQDFTKGNSKTLAQQMEEFQRGYNQPTQQPQQHNGMLNEEVLMNNLRNVVDKYLVENYGVLVEDSVKNVMLETYATSRIKQVIMENKDLIKPLVIEVIRELQQKSKK